MSSTAMASSPASVQLAQDGEALLPIVVHADASDALKEHAATLADYLGRISGGTFVVQEGDGAEGIYLVAVDTHPDAANLPGAGAGAERFDAEAPTRREEYLLQSHPRGLRIVGATDDAVSHAVWDLLYRLGYRQYMPSERWEIVPERPTLAIAVDDFQAPDFIQRQIWNGGGYQKFDEEPHKRWRARNRVARGLQVGASHIWDLIVYRNREAFEQHPEWLALRDGERSELKKEGNKFCLANDELRQFIVDWAIGYIEQHPQIEGVSQDPSDGRGWCECSECAAMGSITDQVITMANQVAVAINEHFETPKYVGLLAYADHSPPPTIDVHPRIIVVVAKGFLRGGYTFEELLHLWGEKGVTLGVYDYLGVLQWSWDMPGRGRSTRRSYAKNELPYMYRNNARLYVGEAESNWGPAGVNYFAIARTLWDIDEAQRVDEIFDTFLDECFGSAAEPMRRFYDLINGDQLPLISRDLVGRMYRTLAEAQEAAQDPAENPGVLDRIADLVLYTRYVEVYLDYRDAEGDERQAQFEKLYRYVWSIRHTMMVHTFEIWRNLRYNDKKVSLPDEAYYRIPTEKNPWKQDPAPTSADVQRFLAEGIANNPLFAFEVKQYSSDLVPATPLDLPETDTGTFGGGTQGHQLFYTWVADAPAEIPLTVTGGLIRHYRDRGDARIKLLSGDEADDMPLDEARVPPTGEPHEIVLRAQQKGLHRIEINDGGDRTNMEWAEGCPMTLLADPTTRISYPLSWTLYFYVPPGSTRVAGYCSHPSGVMVNADGETVFDFTEMDGKGFFDVPVGEGQDGRVWKFVKCSGQRLLMTVPPCLARSSQELLLPREVVER